MKPTSIVFLVIALLLLIVGIVTCSIAKDIAETDGYELFTTTDDTQKSFRESIPDSMHKIDLVFTDAEIQIIGGAEESYIEFSNFQSGLYTVSTTNSVFSFDEIPNIKSLLSGNSGFSFSGIRHFLRAGHAASGEKQISIYLKDTSSLKSISISGNNCTLEIQKLKTKCDISIKADSTLEIRSDFLRTACVLSADSPRLTMNLNNVSLHSLNVQSKHAQISSQSTFFDQVSIQAESGSIDIGASVSLSMYGYQIEGDTEQFTLHHTKTALPHIVDKPREKSGIIQMQLGSEIQVSLHDITDNS